MKILRIWHLVDRRACSFSFQSVESRFCCKGCVPLFFHAWSLSDLDVNMFLTIRLKVLNPIITITKNWQTILETCIC